MRQNVNTRGEEPSCLAMCKLSPWLWSSLVPLTDRLLSKDAWDLPSKLHLLQPLHLCVVFIQCGNLCNHIAACNQQMWFSSCKNFESHITRWVTSYRVVEVIEFDCFVLKPCGADLGCLRTDFSLRDSQKIQLVRMSHQQTPVCHSRLVNDCSCMAAVKSQFTLG